MTQGRVQPGVPTGGQFATQTHDEVDIDLSSGPGDEPISEQDATEIARDWYSGSDATMQFATSGAITPDGVDAWRTTATETGDPAPARLVAYLEGRAAEEGIPLDNEQFLRSLNAYDVSLEDLNAMWEDYRVECNRNGQRHPATWAYERGEEFGIVAPPAPPVGTVIDTDQARALPSYTEVEAVFTNLPNRSFRLMARDMARYGERNKDLSRRFTNLDSGTEVFVGGIDAPRGEPPFSSIRITKHA